MKNYLLPIIAIVCLFGISCAPNDTEELSVAADGDYSVMITGVTQSLTYTFSSSNSRTTATVPDDVNHLTIMVLDADMRVVYQQHYYHYSDYYPEDDSIKYDDEKADLAKAPMYDEYYFEKQIPDTLFIPKLPEGSYTILAATAEFYQYYYKDYEPYPADGQSYPDTMVYDQQTPTLESYVTSDGPIFV